MKIYSTKQILPLFFRGASGNESDKAVFAQILVEYEKQVVYLCYFLKCGMWERKCVTRKN